MITIHREGGPQGDASWFPAVVEETQPGPPLLPLERENIEELEHAIACARGLGLFSADEAASLVARARGEDERLASLAQLWDALVWVVARVLINAAARDRGQSIDVAEARKAARAALGL